jgi:PAT family beta-lactamase induction signal transducer AmpG
VTGFAVDAIGWPTFFLSTIAMGIPGMVMLARFVPLGVKEPEFTVDATPRRAPLSAAALAVRGVAGGLMASIGAWLLVALLAALKTFREAPETGFDLLAAAGQIAQPASVPDWVQLVGILIFGAIGGLFVAAVAAARSGAGGDLAEDAS